MILTPHPQAHILRAIADGKEIEWRRSEFMEWRVTDAPWLAISSKDIELRVKPDDSDARKDEK